MNLIFNYLKGSIQALVGMEAEMRSSMVNCR